MILSRLRPLLATLAVAISHAAERPNILVIMADDLGYSDLGCFGGEIRTPHLDQLASNGLQFTRCYNSSRCCPSRASLLTGLTPHQAGIGRFVGNGSKPGYLGRLSDRCVTLAEVLGPVGYDCYAAGKWHVNDPGPIKRGFKEFYGFLHGYAIDSWNPSMMVHLPEESATKPTEPYFATDAITQNAINFVDQSRRQDNPWLLYLAYQAPHFPLQAPPELSDQYEATYARGWDRLREERFARMMKLGLIPEGSTLPPRGPIDNKAVAKAHGSMTPDGMNPSWDSLPADRRADLARRMSVYAAMVENMDANIGRLIEDLRKNDQLDNTIILFLTDNGACAEWEPFGFDLDPKDYLKGKPGHGINSYTNPKPNHLHTGDELTAMGGPGSLFSYGSAWANLSNTPLRLYKHYAHEGGIRGPMIVHWPKGIKDPGGRRDHVVHVMDLMPTFIEMTKASYPTEAPDHPILPLEGRSMLSAIRGEAEKPRTIVFEHERNAAIRSGDWKLVGQNVISRKGIRRDADWELYNLKQDPFELQNLAKTRPEQVKYLVDHLESEAKRTLILPAP
jgi:arylsulfatase